MRRASTIVVAVIRPRNRLRPDNLDRHAAERSIRAAYERRCVDTAACRRCFDPSVCESAGAGK